MTDVDGWRCRDGASVLIVIGAAGISSTFAYATIQGDYAGFAGIIPWFAVLFVGLFPDSARVDSQSQDTDN